MIRGGHFAANRIESTHSDLVEQLARVKLLAKERRLRLLDAVESQMVSSAW